ncbi:MAG: insulinase family protein, partial [Desulfobacteraceae bacterium]
MRALGHRNRLSSDLTGLFRYQSIKKSSDGMVCGYTHISTDFRVCYIPSKLPEYGAVFSVPTPVFDSCGTAHAVEHMVLRGSKKFPTSDIIAFLLRDIGCTHTNARTMDGITCYDLAARTLQEFIDGYKVLLYALFNPTFSDQTFREECWCWDGHYLSGSVFSELQSRESHCPELILDTVKGAVFKGSYLENCPAGHSELLVSLTIDDIKAYHSKWYIPSQTNVWVCGNLDINVLLAATNDALHGVKPDKQETIPPIKVVSGIEYKNSLPGNALKVTVLSFVSDQALSMSNQLAFEILISYFLQSNEFCTFLEQNSIDDVAPICTTIFGHGLFFCAFFKESF